MPYEVWEDKDGRAIVVRSTVGHNFKTTTVLERLIEDMTDDLSQETFDKVQARCDAINKERQC